MPAAPAAICRTNELTEAGAFWTADVASTPVLVTRDDRGTIRAFVNHCRHREVRLVHEKHGVTKMFTCLFHGWTYDAEGQMGGLLVARMMRDNPILRTIRENSALTPLACSLRHGFVWAAPTPGTEIDVASFLGPVDAALTARGVESFLVRERATEVIETDLDAALRPRLTASDTLHMLSVDSAIVLHTKEISIFTLARRQAETDFGEPTPYEEEIRTLEHVLLAPP